MVYIEKITKAVILVGGYGTRLRPLTYTVPKPLVPFINKPILKHQIEALVKVGIKEIILALNYYSELIIKEVKKYKDEFNINIIYSKEQEPLGTAGPLALAKKYLEGHKFFVLNSDVICEFPFEEMIKFHLSHGKEGTILSTSVDDPSRFGLILTEDGTQKIKKFIEKPKEIVANRINAGIYILNPTILDRIELRECSIEREIFPDMAKDEQLMVFGLNGFWRDIGQPLDYIKGQGMYLKHYQDQIEENKNIFNEKNVVIGKNVKIGKNVTILNCAIFDGAKIGNNVVIKNSIIGWNAKIDDGANIDGCSVLGYAVSVEKHAIIDAVKAMPNISLNGVIREINATKP